ncbi:MAG: hypothetical protein ACK5V3_04020 [Bdellovibrionales bacterium]
MKNLSLMIVGLLATGLLTGCPGKSGSTNGTPINNTWNNCPGCGFQNATAAQFGTTMMAQVPQGTLTMAFTGDAQQINFWASQGQNPIFAYQGQIGGSATLQIQQEFLMGACRVVPGTYQMNLIQPGTYSLGVFQFPYVQLVGPTSMTAALVEGVILTDGLGNIRGFSGLLVAQAGLPAFGHLNYSPQMSGQVACGDSIGLRF